MLEGGDGEEEGEGQTRGNAENVRISRRSSVKGSAPKENGKTHHKSSENGGNSSDNNDSDLSSTSNEEEKSESDVASSG